MYATDFEYDGRRLSDYGFIICAFDGSSGLETVETGFQITFNKVRRGHGKKYALAGTQYEECVQSTFQICRQPDSGNPYITNDEYRELVRWLSRNEFHRFRLIEECGNGIPICWFNASFNIRKILHNGMLCGLELEMETDSPFGYGPRITKVFQLAANESATVFDLSDEEGNTRPDLKITCRAAGNMTISNAKTGSAMTIKNCANGEVIDVYGDTMIIQSSATGHAICDDFNYNFLSIGNTYGDRENVLTTTLACEIELSYEPAIKDIPSGEIYREFADGSGGAGGAGGTAEPDITIDAAGHEF